VLVAHYLYGYQFFFHATLLPVLLTPLNWTGTQRNVSYRCYWEPLRHFSKVDAACQRRHAFSNLSSLGEDQRGETSGSSELAISMSYFIFSDSEFLFCYEPVFFENFSMDTGVEN